MIRLAEVYSKLKTTIYLHKHIFPDQLPVVEQLSEGKVVEHTTCSLAVDAGQNLVHLVSHVRTGVQELWGMEDHHFTPCAEIR